MRFGIGLILIAHACWGAAPEGAVRIPLQFQKNQGQFPARVRFLARARGFRLLFSDTETVIETGKAAPVHFTFEGARPAAVTGEGAEGVANYLLGSDRGRWVRGAPLYKHVRLAGLYDGIDVVYYGSESRDIEYDLILAPGADASQIRIRFEGMRGIRINAAGDLVIETSAGSLVQHLPVCYQTIRGDRRNVSARYELLGGGRVVIRVGDYDRSQKLVIDPVLRGTFLGGSGTDYITGIALDSSGNVYVAGTTDASDFPRQGALQSAYGGAPSDVFVTKLDPSLSRIIYSTYLGGSGEDFANRIKVDSTGNAYVTGGTLSTNFPFTTVLGARGNGDVFVAKLDSAGGRLLYSTIVAGPNPELPTSLAVDAAGSAYVSGATLSPAFPVSSGAYDTSHNGAEDGFVFKLNPAGSALTYSTFLGGSGKDLLYGLALTGNGKVYLAGTTYSNDFPVLGGALQSALRGPRDGFLARLNAAGTSLEFSTYLGGTSFEDFFNVAWSPSEEVALSGDTGSTDFPLPPGSQQRYNGGPGDAVGVIVNFPAGTGAAAAGAAGKGWDPLESTCRHASLSIL